MEFGPALIGWAFAFWDPDRISLPPDSPSIRVFGPSKWMSARYFSMPTNRIRGIMRLPETTVNTLLKCGANLVRRTDQPRWGSFQSGRTKWQV